MSIISFDTHTFVKRLTQAGMPEAQAEVLADSQAKLVDEKLSTKHDLKELETRLTHEMKELEARLTHDLKELETRLTHEMKELETRLTHDLKELENRLTHEMKELENRLAHEMKELENRLALQLTIRMGSMLVVGIGIVATLIKIL